MIALALCCVIVLWVVGIIADGPDEMKSCVLLWPLVAGVLSIAILFLFLKCAEHCLKMRKSRKNKKTLGEPLGFRDSLRMYNHKPPTQESIIPMIYGYEQPICIILSYAFLLFALFCVMIGSVVQFYSLDSVCYHHLQETVSELLLGYEVLVYTSLVVLSIVGCCLVCLFTAIVINCCTSRHKSSDDS